MSTVTFPQGPLPIPPLDPEKVRAAAPFVWHVPGSKSITNRALVLAALAEGATTLTGVLHSDDTRHMRNALAALGIVITDVDATTLRVEGGRSRLRAPSEPLFIGNSGTTVRFLAALAALVPGKVTLVGDEHMAKRPISDLVDGLRQLGVEIDCPTGCPPLTIHGGKLPGGTVRMPGDKSSQYFSALLMAAPCAEGPLSLEVVGSLVSRPYVDITLAMMRAFGALVDAEPGSQAPRFRVGGTAAGESGEAAGSFGGAPAYRSSALPESNGSRPTYHIEPDASSASYAFAAGAALGLDVTVPNLGERALQGDYHFVDLLERAGAQITRGAHETRIVGTGTFHGLDVDMHDISDTVMTLAALAPLASGPTRITNVENIRIKETDRLEATVTELSRLGQSTRSGRDWLQVEPGPVTPAVVLSYSDHRMAMAFAILGLCRAGISIENPACVAKTYPTFWQALSRLYAHVGQECPF